MFQLAYGQKCNVTPKCRCDFGGEILEVAEQNAGNEVLAGTVGALSSIVVTGGGFGLWYLLNGRKSASVGDSFDRSDSTLSEDSVVKNKNDDRPPPSYDKPTNTDYETSNTYPTGTNDSQRKRIVASAPKSAIVDI